MNIFNYAVTSGNSGSIRKYTSYLLVYHNVIPQINQWENSILYHKIRHGEMWTEAALNEIVIGNYSDKQSKTKTKLCQFWFSLGKTFLQTCILLFFKQI